jgi:hypothetical protein
VVVVVALPYCLAVEVSDSFPEFVVSLALPVVAPDPN